MKTTKLENLKACEDAIDYVKTQKSAKDAWMNCSRGDWMLWLAKKLDVDDRLLTLAKATCANQVRHLMTDQRSIDALDASFRYAKGELTREELNTYAAASYAAYDAASAAAASASAYASAASSTAAYASSAAYAAAYASAASAASLKKSADICREILTDVVLEEYKLCNPPRINGWPKFKK